jgi:hypothetical protein
LISTRNIPKRHQTQNGPTVKSLRTRPVAPRSTSKNNECLRWLQTTECELTGENDILKTELQSLKLSSQLKTLMRGESTHDSLKMLMRRKACPRNRIFPAMYSDVLLSSDWRGPAFALMDHASWSLRITFTNTIRHSKMRCENGIREVDRAIHVILWGKASRNDERSARMVHCGSQRLWSSSFAVLFLVSWANVATYSLSSRGPLPFP